MISQVVLILTVETDVTAQVVTDELRRRGVEYHILDAHDLPMRATLSGNLSNDGLDTTWRGPDGVALDISRVGSVWSRRPSEFGFPSDMAASTQAFARAEMRQAFSGLLLSNDVLWMNEPRFESLAALKVVQLKFARALGLRIPRTLVTNDPRQAEAFFDSVSGNVLFKRMSPQLLVTESGGATSIQSSKLTAKHRAHLDNVRVTACCFQEYVEKAYELRVTVVGDRVFAARIDSQSHPDTMVDWRSDTELPWFSYDLPTEVSDRLVEFLRALNLKFGAFDLIRTPEGEYVFLECNPAGQWAWFDDEITHGIRDAIVDLLVSGKSDG